jgi:hypothetical protein
MQKHVNLIKIFRQGRPSFLIRREQMFVNTQQRWRHCFALLNRRLKRDTYLQIVSESRENSVTFISFRLKLKPVSVYRRCKP